MKKSIWLMLLLVIVAIAAGVGEAHRESVCGKFSPDRMLKHVLRHCAKPAREATIPVPPRCCQALRQVGLTVSEACLHAMVNSDTFKNSGLDPQVAFSVPKRCHLVP